MLAKNILHLLKFECLIYIRKPSQMLNPLFFFILVLSLFPMGMSVETALLQKIAPGLIWVAFLLSSLLNIDRLFFYDFSSGILEQHLISKISLVLRIYIKMFIYWLMMALPLIICCPLLGIMYDLNSSINLSLVLSLLCGTPILITLMMILAAMVLGAGNRGSLLSLVFLPLTIPVLIFGAGCVTMTMQGMDAMPIYLILIGLSLICLSLGPLMIRKCLYLSLE